MWVVALVLDYTIVLVAPPEGWHISPGHFAERFGLIVIIALGESIVALGVGASELELDLALVAAGALTMVVVASLWWAYFDVVAIVAERRFREAQGAAQVLIARDSYALIHLPMIAGIVLFALGVKKATEHLGDPLKDAPRWRCAAGWRSTRSRTSRSACATWARSARAGSSSPALSLAVIPVATNAAALIALALLAALWTGLIAYEALRFAEARHRLHASARAWARAARVTRSRRSARAT